MSQTIVHEVLAKKPKRRVEWVQKRLKEDLAIQHRDSLYEVLVRKEGKAFASDINGADAMRTYNAVLAAIDLFTTKQQRHLQAETFYLRKLHTQEQEKQERFAREAKARAQEAKKAAKAAKERPPSTAQTRKTRVPSPVPLQDSPRVVRTRSPDNQGRNVDSARSRSRSPLRRKDATTQESAQGTKSPEAERSPSPDWIPRTPPDPPTQVPTKSTGSWTTTVFEASPTKDERAPTVVAPRPEPPRSQASEGQIFRSLDDVSTLGVKELSKDAAVAAGKGSASSTSTEYDAFGTGPDPVTMRSPSRERKGTKPAPAAALQSSRNAAAEASDAAKRPKEDVPADPPPLPTSTRQVPSEPQGSRPPPEASSEAAEAVPKRDGGNVQTAAEEDKSRPPPSKVPAVKEEQAPAPSKTGVSEANGTATAAQSDGPGKPAKVAASSEAAATSKTGGPAAKSESASEESEEEEEAEEEDESEEAEDDAEEGSDSESSSGGEASGSLAATSPAQEPGGDNPPGPEPVAKRAAAAPATVGLEGSGSESSGSSESADGPKPVPKVKLVKIEASRPVEAAVRTKPILEPAKREYRRRQPPPPPPPRRSGQRRRGEDVKVLEVPSSAHAPQLPQWRYMAPDGQERLAIRSGPGMDAPTTGLSLASGEVFPVSQERPGDGGVLFLRIADGRGWVFDRRCGRARKRRVRPLCVPYQVPLLEDEGERAAPKAAVHPRALGPDGPLPLDRLSSLAKPRNNRKARKRRPATMDPYMAASMSAQLVPGEVIEVGSDDDGGPPEDRGGAKLGRKKQIKEELRLQLERKQNEVQALRTKLNQLDTGQAPSHLPVRRVVMRSSNDSRIVGMAETPEGAYQHGQLADEKRQQLQAMLAKKRAMGFAQSPPAKKPTPRFVD